ncbi:MAG: EAL domain-containing protein [Gammaproteobacteria bacterium]|nr:EAL domain-containing protein [Gammaproteobacteria bacterium]
MNAGLSLRVLLVEDNPTDVLLLRESLAMVEALNFEVLARPRLAEALKLLAEERFDIALLDLGLPDSQGLEAFHRVHSLAPSLPVIVLTGMADDAVAMAAVQAGAQDYIGKGWFEGPMLVRAIRHAIERQRVSEALRASEQRTSKLYQAVEQSRLAIAIVDGEARVEYVNPSLCALTGYSAEELRGRCFPELLLAETAPERHGELVAALASDQVWEGELQHRAKNGQVAWLSISLGPIRVDGDEVSHFVATIEDISVRKSYEERLLHQANYDQLTGLPNRLLALDRLGQAVAGALRENRAGALLFIDLDSFKKVNDSLGHSVGDELLVMAAQRLSACVRAGHTVARFGGDEFIVILPELEQATAAERVAKRILQAFESPFSLANDQLFVSCSIGITLFPVDGDQPQALLQNADAAMYRAKALGRNTYQYFTPQMNVEAIDRLKLENHLRYALERQELSLVFQPLVNLASGRISGVEALLRWNSAALGFVPPDVFIPIAEETGLIVPIGEWVLVEACKGFQTLRGTVPELKHLAVNVSARQFRGGQILKSVQKALKDSGLGAECLELEITERLLLGNAPETREMLESLSGLGARLSIDDFGTGYSALSYIRSYPFQVLKIDRSFVADVTTVQEHASLAVAIIAMGHSLGLEVIGEGVETAEQLAFLREHGCDVVQGYFYSKPLPLGQFLAWAGNRQAGA